MFDIHHLRNGGQNLFRRNLNVSLHIKRWQLNCHWYWCNLSTALKAVFCLIVLICSITSTISGRNV